MADNILSDFGINILEEEIDDVIFQTNEFLCDATFTGAQGPFWWLLVVSAFQCFLTLKTICNSTTCKILFHETNPRRDKNGTKPQENKIKNASSSASLVMDFSFLCKGTILSRELQAKPCKYAAYQTFIPHGHFREDTASASCTDLCCLSQRPVKIRFMPFVHYAFPPMYIALDKCTTYLPLSAMLNVCSINLLVKNTTWHNDRTKRHI